ncbi:hypothetical protein GGX14DRAFT_574106 [Mycena pura]|uniref:Uncharacterized protein n=1 Tax=Mycena pura TaxID=153505 RepID=A0AAD6V252_9AGAR|nr:hypothetical protein GGX14DRAFT_574106 [Mycena pura]
MALVDTAKGERTLSTKSAHLLATVGTLWRSSLGRSWVHFCVKLPFSGHDRSRNDPPLPSPPSLTSIPLICPRQLLVPNSFGPALFIQLLGALFSFHSVSFSSHRFQNYRKVGFAPARPHMTVGDALPALLRLFPLTGRRQKQLSSNAAVQVFRRLPLALSWPGAVPVSLSSHSKMSGVHKRSRTNTLPYSDDVLLVPVVSSISTIGATKWAIQESRRSFELCPSSSSLCPGPVPLESVWYRALEIILDIDRRLSAVPESPQVPPWPRFHPMANENLEQIYLAAVAGYLP